MSPFVRRLRAAGLALAVLASGSGAALAAPTAVELVFEKPYLAALEPGATVSYRFVRTAAGDTQLAPSFEDDVTLNVATDRGEKAVNVEMFTGKRAQTFGPLSSNGNPVIITLLELDVREMQKILGGNPYYIRNRMRDALNDGGTVEPVTIAYEGRSIDGWKLTLKPFEKDAKRDKLRDFADRSYELTFSDQAPGGLVSLVTITPRQGGDKPLLVENLTLKGAGEAAPAASSGAAK